MNLFLNSGYPSKFSMSISVSGFLSVQESGSRYPCGCNDQKYWAIVLQFYTFLNIILKSNIKVHCWCLKDFVQTFPRLNLVVFQNKVNFSGWLHILICFCRTETFNTFKLTKHCTQCSIETMIEMQEVTHSTILYSHNLCFVKSVLENILFRVGWLSLLD